MSTRYGAFTVNAAAGVAELTPDLIIPDVTATAARQEVFMPHVRRLDRTGPGEVFTVPTAGALAFAQLGSQTYIDGTAPIETAFNTGGRTFTPSFWFLDVIVPLDAIQGAAPAISVQDEVIKEASIGLAAHHDALFAALHTEPITSPQHNVGTNAVELNFVSIRTAYQLLLAANAPRPFAWVIHPIQVTELLKDNTFIDAAKKGAPVLTNGIGEGGFLTGVLDFDFYVSDTIVESSGLHSLVLSKNAALGYVFKQLQNPSTGQTSELMMDMDWNSARRSVEINMTYQAAVGGLKGTSTTTNNWMVDFIS